MATQDEFDDANLFGDLAHPESPEADDLIPEDDMNLATAPIQPYHSSSEDEGDSRRNKTTDKDYRHEEHEDDDDDVFGDKEIDSPYSKEKKKDTHDIALPAESNDSQNKMTHFDLVVDQLKARTKRRRRDVDTEEATEYCKSIIDTMHQAADADDNAFREGRPSMAKVQLVDAVCQEISKKKFSEHFLSNGAGKAISRWLLPLMDGSLPPLDLRTKLVKLVSVLDIDPDLIANAELGKRLLYIWKHERTKTKISEGEECADPENRQLCASVCLKWMNEVLQGNL